MAKTNETNSKLRLTKEDEGKLRPKPVKEVEAGHGAKPAPQPKPSLSSAVKSIKETLPAYAKSVTGAKEAQELEQTLSATPKPGPSRRHKRKLAPTPTPPGIHKEK